MDIRISKESEVPVRLQLAQQITYLIATQQLKPGEALPSVRVMARRLGIHHNTVSEAYQELVSRTWLVRRRGSHVLVRGEQKRAAMQDLNDLINALIRSAQRQGYSLQALRDLVRQRLLAQPPDHILVVEEEPGLRQLLQYEIQQAVRWRVSACSRAELTANRGLSVGALMITPEYAIADVDPLALKLRPAIPIAFSAADDQVAMIGKLREPSVIAVVSVSELFLRTAQGVLAPAIKRKHALVKYCLPLDSPSAVRGADLVLCDAIAFDRVRHPKRLMVRLVRQASLDYLTSAMESYQEV